MSVEKSPQEALAWVADIFEAPAEKIRPETRRDEVEAWDSLGILTLIARLDEDFHILLTEEEIQELRSVGDILGLIRKHGILRDD
jgi:acyl carrier protein